MKSLFVALIILTAFASIPILASAQTDQPSADNTRISQALIREGDLAVELAAGLKVGAPKNEAEAEDALSAAGIIPSNGWIADYPATPDIIGELQAAVSAAADAGKLSVGKDAALQSFQQIVNADNLPITPDVSGTGGVEGAAPDYPDTAAMDDYYSSQGPPVVTYYAPPPDDAYLYSWVPYPFWSSNFWFPGFFVLADFNVPAHHGHHHHGHDGFITNHFHDPRTGGTTRIDPANRFRGGTFVDGRTRVVSRPAVGNRQTGVVSRPVVRDSRVKELSSPAAAGREFRGYGVTQNHVGTRSSAFEHSVNSQTEHAASDRGFQSRSSAGQIPGGGQGGGRPVVAPRGGGGGGFRGGGGGGGFHGGGGGRR